MLKFDEVGYWSEIKLDIVRDYATAYSVILAKQKGLKHLYIDAFAGAGVHISKRTGEYIPGSPLNALNVHPPFFEYHFIDMDQSRVQNLQALSAGHAGVHVHEGNCNDLLLSKVFPRAEFSRYRRALCLLDPYGLTLDWKVMEAAGKMGSIDMFLNFPIMDMNRNALWSNPSGVDAADLARMTAFWGDESWRSITYASQGNLFGDDDLVKQVGNEPVVKAFQKRLREGASFANVPEPLPMRNKLGKVVYYLFFASQNSVANKIIEHIFRKYRSRGGTP